jgi:hypothetical protein
MVRQRQRIIELQDQVQVLRRRIIKPPPPSDDQWDRLELEVIRARRYHRPLALIVVGSTTVDAARVQSMLREVDLVLQVGQRLVVALPETGASAESVRDRIVGLFGGAPHALVNFPADGADLEALLAASRIG